MKKALIISGILTTSIGATMALGGTTSLPNANPSTFGTVEEFQTAESNFKETSPDGHFAQVIKDNKPSPNKKNATIKGLLGKETPAGMWVDEYQSPLGFGYQMYYEDATAWYSVGKGPEATARTYTRLKSEWATRNNKVILP